VEEQLKEEFEGREIRVSLRAGAMGNRLAEAQEILPFGYSSINGESLEGSGPGEEGKVPTYLEAIANLKDILAYCYICGRMTFEIGEDDDEAREIVEALDEEARTITPQDSQRVLERVTQSGKNE
jgi:hypothetical protein